MYVKHGRQTKGIVSIQLLPIENEPDYDDEEEPEQRVFLLSASN